MENTSLKGRKGELILNTDSECLWLRIWIQVTPNDMFHYGNSATEFM